MSSLASLYVKAALSRKPSLVPTGAVVARLEGQTPFVADAQTLQAYRSVCQWPGDAIPLTFPHVAASRLHLELLTSAGFPVKLLGLVHLANRIDASVSVPREGTLHAFLEGFADTERGHEFELKTELRTSSGVAWRERSTFLARKPKREGSARTSVAVRPTPERTVTLEAPSGLGRRYGRLAGDLNPIHVFDVTAKLFGFPRAIAHGMWSLARIAAELGVQDRGSLEVRFKSPVLLPSKPVLEVFAGGKFCLVDAKGERVHLEGVSAPGA